MNEGDVKKTFGVSLMMTLLWPVLLVQNHEGVTLDRNKAITQYVHTVWHDKDGLPQNTVRAITQTRDGYLWIGRPWLYMQSDPFDIKRALAVARTTPY